MSDRTPAAVAAWEAHYAAMPAFSNASETFYAGWDAAQQTPKPGTPGVHWECDCVPDLGPSHCHECGNIAGGIVAWADTIHGPASTTGSDQ